MHIMYMLGIISLIFLAALLLMCIFRERLNHPIVNPLLICACAIFMFSWTYAMYEHNGLKSGFMTFDNISPYICTVIPLTPLMNKKVRDFAYCAMAFLGFGMFVAMFISPEVEYILRYSHDTKFIHVTEAACHLIMGVYGFYLILSNKVKITLKNLAKGAAFIYASIAFGLFLNFFFHKSYFGMNMYGNHSIYFMDLFDSFGVTLVAYLLGVLFTIIVGFFVGMFLDWLSRPKHEMKKAQEATQEITQE